MLRWTEPDVQSDAGTGVATCAALLRCMSEEPFLSVEDVSSTLQLPDCLDAMPIDGDVASALVANLRWSPPGYNSDDADAAPLVRELGCDRSPSVCSCF